MRRNTIIKRIIGILENNDVFLISGKGLISPVFDFDDERMFYFKRLGMAIPFGIGLALTSNKRIFIICEDVDMIRSFSSMAQAAASRCPNLFIIIIGCGRYQDSGGQPSIFTEIRAPKGALFNFGFVSHDLSRHFKDRLSVKNLQNLFKHFRGPMAIYIEADLHSEKLNEVEYEPVEVKNRFKSFVQDLELGTSLFVP